MQVDPQYRLPLVYELTDPFDSTTYYIRAVIKDSLTGDTLNTVDLISQGSGRYTSSAFAPQDPSGQGRHIDVTISVYTDAGYSVYSENYQKKIDKYLVKRTTSNFGGVGGVDIDYKKIEKIIEKIISEKISEIPAIDFSTVLDGLNNLKKQISGIDIPEFPVIKPTDLSPVMKAIDDVGKSIVRKVGAIHIPEQKETDLSPVILALTNVKKEVEALTSLSATQKTEILKTIEDTIQKKLDTNQEARNKKLKELATAVLQDENIKNTPTPPVPPATVTPAPIPPKPENPVLSKYFR